MCFRRTTLQYNCLIRRELLECQYPPARGFRKWRWPLANLNYVIGQIPLQQTQPNRTSVWHRDFQISAPPRPAHHRQQRPSPTHASGVFHNGIWPVVMLGIRIMLWECCCCSQMQGIKGLVCFPWKRLSAEQPCNAWWIPISTGG